ncbi:MAG: extracellular solute-binding protein [Spirochaetia bacterium]
MKRQVLVFCVVLLACGGMLFASGKTEGAASSGGPAPQLIVQLMDNEQPDVPAVTAEINKILLKNLNVTVKFQHFTWTDWQQKYKLLVTSGEPADLLYAANWNNYAQYARDGAYKQLDDMLPKVAPELIKAIPKTSWDGVKIQGKIWAVPPLRYGYSGTGHLLYRADLQKKWGVAPVTDWNSFYAYLDAVKKNAPDMVPCEDFGNTSEWVSSLLLNTIAKDNPQNAWFTAFLTQSQLLWFDFRNQKPDNIKAIYEFPEYKPFLQTMHDLAGRGYWSPDVLAEKSIGSEIFEAGKSAATAGGAGTQNIDKTQELIQRVAKNNPTWEVGELSWDKVRGWAIPAAAQQDLTTVPIQSKYPELALKVTSAMLLDKDLQFLIDYGIKGVHYDIGTKGEYVQLPGAKNYMLFGMAAWAWKNQSMFLADGSVWGPQHDAYLKYYDTIAVPNTGFALDTSPINAELTACIQVEQQYGWPLWFGLVPNIDDAEKTFEQQLQAAGIEKVRAEIKKQLAQYQKEIGQ